MYNLNIMIMFQNTSAQKSLVIMNIFTSIKKTDEIRDIFKNNFDDRFNCIEEKALQRFYIIRIKLKHIFGIFFLIKAYILDFSMNKKIMILCGLYFLKIPEIRQLCSKKNFVSLLCHTILNYS